MPRIKAEVGSVIMLVSDQWENSPHGHRVAVGELGEVTDIDHSEDEYPYHVEFGERTLPLKRSEFTTL